jgi:hypothetical protein
LSLRRFSWIRHPDRCPQLKHQCALRILYEVDVIGGTLRNEVGGTTDLACWFPLDGVSELDRASLVDMGLSMRISC